MRTVSLLATVASFAFGGCLVLPFGYSVVVQQRHTAKVGSCEEMRNRLLELIPVGTSRSEAEQRLRSEWFTFEFVKDSDFCPGGLGEDQPKVSKIDYIAGRRKDSRGWFEEHHWTVAVVIERAKVVDILVGRWVNAL